MRAAPRWRFSPNPRSRPKGGWSPGFARRPPAPPRRCRPRQPRVSRPETPRGSIPGPGTGRSGTTGVPSGATCFLPGERARGSSSCPPRLPRGSSFGAVLLPLSIPACPAGRRGLPAKERRGGGIGKEGDLSPARGNPEGGQLPSPSRQDLPQNPGLLLPAHQEDHLGGRVQHGKRQGDAGSGWIPSFGLYHPGGFLLQGEGTGEQRCGVPVGAQPQQDRVEPGEVPWGPPEGAPERLFVPARSLPRVGQGGVDRVEVTRGDGGAGHERLPQHPLVACRVAGGNPTLVDLVEMDEIPRKPVPVRLGGKGRKRETGGSPSGEGQGNPFRPFPGPAQECRPLPRDPPKPPRRRPGQLLRRRKHEEPAGRVVPCIRHGTRHCLPSRPRILSASRGPQLPAG